MHPAQNLVEQLSSEACDRDFADRLGEIAPFVGLPDAVRTALANSAIHKSYDAGQTVYSIGQFDASEFAVVLSGELKVSTLDAETGAIFVEQYDANSLFGLEFAMVSLSSDLIQQAAATAVTAESALSILVFDAENFRKLVNQRPSLMRNLVDLFAQSLVTLRCNATNAQSAPEQRVYAVLLQYAEKSLGASVWRIAKMPKHRELAEQAGVDETVAANAVATLIQEGAAHRDYPGLIIEDMNRLNQLAT